MRKAVLISIQPKWCELIASGKKTIEVRKTKPKIQTPFKCYIYQTKRTWIYNIYSKIADWQQKVIGEFVCDNIDKMSHCGNCSNDIKLRLLDKYFCAKDLDWEYLNNCRLSYADLVEYSNGGNIYGWHISDLKIYDKPKELCEFHQPCKNLEEYEGEVYCDCFNCDYGEDSDYGVIACRRTITRPPQSWCYVERLEGEQ